MPGETRDSGGIVVVDDMALRWSVKSGPIRRDGGDDVGLRLSVRRHDPARTRHGTLKAWRELVLQFPFEKLRHAGRFPERPKVTPERLHAAIRLALDAGWEPHSRGRPFELVLEEGDLP